LFVLYWRRVPLGSPQCVWIRSDRSRFRVSDFP